MPTNGVIKQLCVFTYYFQCNILLLRALGVQGVFITDPCMFLVVDAICAY